MAHEFWKRLLGRRRFLKESAGGLLLSLPLPRVAAAAPVNPLFLVKDIPNQPFTRPSRPNDHAGVNAMLELMGENGLKFHRTAAAGLMSGPQGMIAADDVVLVKVNAQWKYRGCTNSDVVRGLVQKILDHPEGFRGEVVIFENGQGGGSLNCDTANWYGDFTQHANANDESHSFLFLVNNIFQDSRVSAILLDDFRGIFVDANDHTTTGYRTFENVSYPCFTTAGGRRVELQEGLWTGAGYAQNLKLINVPVLKHHDTYGSEITCSLKHMYGVVSMSDGQSNFRHYGGLGETCGKVMASVRTPVLNLVDAIWVSQGALMGYPADKTFRANQLLASQDPVAADYWAAKYIIYPIDHNLRHHPDYPGINAWLAAARDLINARGGLSHPESGILVSTVTKNEAEMVVYTRSLANSVPRSVSPFVQLLLQD